MSFRKGLEGLNMLVEDLYYVDAYKMMYAYGLATGDKAMIEHIRTLKSHNANWANAKNWFGQFGVDRVMLRVII